MELTNRKKQAMETRNKIYEVSIKLMEEKGYNDVKIEDICRDAGVSVGSFYNYFKSKNDILLEIYSRADNFFKNVVEKKLNKKSAAENIVLLFNYYASYNETTGVETMKQLYAPSNKLFIKKGRYMQTVLSNVIKKGQDDGEIISDMTAEEITEYLFIAARGVGYDWTAHEGSYDLKEFSNNYFTRLIKIFLVN